MIRLFLREALTADGRLTLTREQAHYLGAVMRRGAGDDVAVFNGRDGEWRAVIARLDRKGAELALAECLRPQTAPPDLEVWAALVKRDRFETIIEKAAELGAARVQPVVTQFTQSAKTNLSRLELIAVEAAEQTGRLDVPVILPPVSLAQALKARPEGRTLIFCDEAGDAAPMAEALAASAHEAATILIGPEGGFSPEERAMLRGLDRVLPVSLGPRILRADTAAIAAMTLWQSVRGDWRAPA